MLSGKAVAINNEMAQYVTETTMYQPSNLMKSLQYVTEDNIIRIWDDGVMNYCKSSNIICSSKVFEKVNEILIK